MKGIMQNHIAQDTLLRLSMKLKILTHQVSDQVSLKPLGLSEEAFDKQRNQ